MNLRRELLMLRPQMITAAQKEYDEWSTDENGMDPEIGSGGICDRISEAIASVIVSSMDDIEIMEGGHEGDDHAFIIAYRGNEAYLVDIPASIYEIGGGYSWKKREGIKFRPEYVTIEPVEVPVFEDRLTWVLREFSEDLESSFLDYKAKYNTAFRLKMKARVENNPIYEKHANEIIRQLNKKYAAHLDNFYNRWCREWRAEHPEIHQKV